MSDLRALKQRLNLRKNVSFAMAEFAINMALLFISYRLIIKQGGLEAVGVWATLYAWTNLIRLGDAGVSGAATRFLALWDIKQEPERIRIHGETALITNLVQFTLLGIIGYLALSPFVSDIVGETYATEAKAILPLMMLGFVLLNVSGTLLGILQGLHLGYRRSQLSVFGTTIQLVTVLALVPSLGLMGLALAQIIQHATIAVIGWLIARRLLGSGIAPSRFQWPAFRSMLGYSLKAQVVNIANGLVEPISKMLVGHFGGMATQGLYELAYKTVLQPRNLIATGITAMLPAMSALYQSDRAELRRVYHRAFRLGVLSMGAAVIGIIALAPVPSWLWLGRIDNTYWLYVATIGTGFFFNVLGVPAYLIGMASGRLRNNMLITSGTLIGLVALGFPSGLLFGGNGTVFASTIIVALCGILMLATNRKLLL